MAFENIFAAESLVVTDNEFREEYEGAVRDFKDKAAEYDDERLREQVSETLKVNQLSSPQSCLKLQTRVAHL